MCPPGNPEIYHSSAEPTQSIVPSPRSPRMSRSSWRTSWPLPPTSGAATQRRGSAQAWQSWPSATGRETSRGTPASQKSRQPARWHLWHRCPGSTAVEATAGSTSTGTSTRPRRGFTHTHRARASCWRCRSHEVLPPASPACRLLPPRTGAREERAVAVEAVAAYYGSSCKGRCAHRSTRLPWLQRRSAKTVECPSPQSACFRFAASRTRCCAQSVARNSPASAFSMCVKKTRIGQAQYKKPPLDNELLGNTKFYTENPTLRPIVQENIPPTNVNLKGNC